MVSFHPPIKRFCLLLVCVLPFACIDEEGDLSTLPTVKVLKTISIVSEDVSTTRAWGQVTDQGDRMEITWGSSNGFNPLPFQELPKRTVFTFQTGSKVIKEINTVFSNDDTFTDFFEYDQQKKLSKIRREHKSKGLEYLATFFYRGTTIDSVALELSTTVDGKVTKQPGFFRYSDESYSGGDTYLSIFPFDKTKPYSLGDQFNYSQVSINSNNDLHQRYHTFKRNEMGWGEVTYQIDHHARVALNEYQARQYHSADGIYVYESDYAYDDPRTSFHREGTPLDNTTTPKYSNQGVGYCGIFAGIVPQAYLVNEVFYLIDHSKKVEKDPTINFDITYIYEWNEAAP